MAHSASLWDHNVLAFFFFSLPQATVVEYLISRPEVDRETAIDALELLGASFANDKVD